MMVAFDAWPTTSEWMLEPCAGSVPVKTLIDEPAGLGVGSIGESHAAIASSSPIGMMCRVMVLRRWWTAAGLVAALGAAITGAPQTTFKAGNRTVAVYATVTDRVGRLVPDLSRDDFVVEDDGRRQTLTVFDNRVQPITIVMLLDRSGSMEGNFDLVRHAAEAFVGQLLPDDKAKIGSFSNRIQVDPGEFTSNRDELVGILRTQLQTRGPTPLWNAVDVGITALLGEEGRRVILVFTDGTDFPFNFQTRNTNLKEVMKRADEENVMVYAIGLAGQRVATPIKPGLTGRRGSERPVASVTPPIMPIGRPDPGLALIAAETGGGYFELTSADDLAGTFTRVAEELHQQYVLGFTPETLDGRTHRLMVRVSGADTVVRARKTYLAAKE
jgi:VWFA-related protein